jgi:hypothetical protein
VRIRYDRLRAAGPTDLGNGDFGGKQLAKEWPTFLLRMAVWSQLLPLAHLASNGSNSPLAVIPNLQG